MRVLFAGILALAFTGRRAEAQTAPPLPPPSGRVVSVATEPQLQAAVFALASGTTVLIQPGTYRLTRELQIANGVTNVALRGATGNRNDVVILGSGMKTPGVNIAIKVMNAQNVLIANLSVGQTYRHPIQLQGEQGAERVHIYNVRAFDAGEQFIKSTVDLAAPNGVDDSIVEYSLIEFTGIGPDLGYTEGIDVHHGANWIIRYNVFRNIHVPAGATYVNRPAVLMWTGSRNTIVHGNMIIDCERGIVFGQGGQSQYGHSHEGGAIYNNFIYRTQPLHADSGISVWDSPGTHVFHNTVIQNGTYPVAIEYRFSTTTGVQVMNNLTDGAIIARDGAHGVMSNNYTAATPSMFVNAAAGDLHLRSNATAAIDQGVYLPEVPTDWDGDRRPIGAAVDLGADEFAGASSSPPPTAALAAPTNLQATLVSGEVRLTWQDRSAGETEYAVERSPGQRDSFVVIARLPANSTRYVDTGLPRGNYRYRVRALAAAGTASPYSTVVNVRVN
jgi:hypothetical protein